MSSENKKKMYVPDEELLAYNKAKSENGEASSEPIEEIKSTDSVAEYTDGTSATEKKNSSKVKAVLSKTKAALQNAIPKKNDAKKTIAIKCVAILAALAIIVSGVYLAVYFADLGMQDAKLDNTRNTYELNRYDYSKNEDNQFSKFDVLKSQNTDIVGWITIPETEVDNPVYQCDDNQYYVTHDMDKESNSYGALFLDYRCDINPLSVTQNQVIYGHNMRYGAMFGTLKSYRELDFYKKSPVIYFDSLYEQRVYKIFAVMVVNDSEDNTFGYTYSPYRAAIAEEEFMTWIDRSRQRSLFDTTVDVQPQDEIITLSTCCYDYDNARFVIMGRLVRDGESAEVNTADAVVNSDCLYSKEYYNKKGMSIPDISSAASGTKK